MTRENETRILGMIQNNGLSRHIYQDSQGNFKDASTFALVPVPSLSSWASPTQNADPCTLVLLLEQDLKLNSIYEFVGFYESQQDEQLLFIASEFIPVSLPDSDNFIQVQKDLRDATTALLFGDDIAADYLLSQLFSTRVSQQTQKFHLNISNFPQDSQFLSKFYQDLVPISKYIPQTIESLNKLIYCPTMDNGGSTTAQQVEKEYDTLNQGELQLPDYSIVILDEFTMNDGTLFERGLRNVQSVVDILKYGELNYGIAFGSFAVKCNVSVLVTSIGKSMFPVFYFNLD